MKPLKHGTAKIKVSQLKTVRFYSVDVLGNVEKARKLPK